MIPVNLVFTIEEAISFFENMGFEVKNIDIKTTFNSYHGQSYTADVPTWCVKHPNTMQYVPLIPIINKYFENKKQELFLQEDNKLKIINLFDK